MSTTLPHALLTFSGILGFDPGDEIWSMQVKVGIADTAAGPLVAPTQADLQALANSGSIGFVQFYNSGVPSSSSAFPLSPWVGYQQCKAAAKLATGKDDPTLTPALVESIPTTRWDDHMPDAAGTIYEMSYVEALCVSLTGSTYRTGAASHGRFYLPLPNKFWNPTASGAAIPMINGLMDPAVVASFLGGMRTFLQQINSTSLAGGHSAYVMNISTSDDLAGIRFQKVTNCSIDARPDTIRRRSNALAGSGRQTSPAF